MKKRVFYSEMAYILGLLILALGTAFMERANFGVSMVVAPAYILHLALKGQFPFFTFGMAEYTLQAQKAAEREPIQTEAPTWSVAVPEGYDAQLTVTAQDGTTVQDGAVSGEYVRTFTAHGTDTCTVAFAKNCNRYVLSYTVFHFKITSLSSDKVIFRIS